MGLVKNTIRKVLIALRWPLTRNLRYDILTQKILCQLLKDDTSCVDVGAHKGEMIDMMRKYAPNGVHFAFEPIPQLYKGLKNKSSDKLSVYPYALSNFEGKTSFHLVKDAPAYSGIKRRQYKQANPEVELIEVEVRKMDDVLRERQVSLGLIKIDVEGGELDVMKGAQQILKKDKPHLIFECGKGASEFYNNTPEMVYAFLHEMGYKIYALETFLNRGVSYKEVEFVHTFQSGAEYYFIAVNRY